MSKVGSVFLTGANRGIGLQLAKDILAKLKPQKLFATYRDPKNSTELSELSEKNKSLRLIQMDVRDFDNYGTIVNKVNEELGGKGLNLLINNAAISGKFSRLQNVKEKKLIQEMRDSFETNTLAPILLTKAFYPLLDQAYKSSSLPSGIQRAAVVNFSSILGSMTENVSGGQYEYRCSKAALNSATKSMSIDFKNSGLDIVVVAIHPGWVKTDMGGPKAPLKIVESTEGIITILENLDSTCNGKFLQYDGTELEW